MPFSKQDLILENDSFFIDHYGELFCYFERRYFDALPLKFDEQIIHLRSRCLGFDLYFNTIQNADFYLNQKLWIDLQYFKKNGQYFLYITKIYRSKSENIEHLAIKKKDLDHSSLLECVEKISQPTINLLDDFREDIPKLPKDLSKFKIIPHENQKS